MNSAGLIKRFGKSYTVTRANADGSYSATDGTFQPGSSTTLSMIGSVQPMTPEDLVSIPEGDRTKERLRFYSTPGLKNNDTAHLRKSDVISIGGQDYQVESVEHWPNYSKAIVVRVNTNAN